MKIHPPVQKNLKPSPYQGEGPRSGGEGYFKFTNGEKKAATINPKIQAKLFQPVQSDIRPGSGQC